MSTTPARGRVSPSSASVSPDLGQNKVASAPRPANHDPDRRLCAFTFSSGHQCRMPRRSGHPYLCFFHARKEAQALAADNVGEEIANYLSGAYVSACDLNAALGRLFVAVAQGLIPPKTASTLAYLAQSLVQALHLAQNEYINAFGTNAWRSTIRSSFPPPDPPAQPPTQTSPARSAPPQPASPPQNASPTPPAAPAPQTAAPAPPDAASSPTGPQSPCSGRSSDRPISAASPSARPESHHTQPSAVSASQISPAREGWDASPGPSLSAGGAAQSPTVDRQPPTACPEPFGVNSPTTQPSAGGASNVSPARQGWVQEPTQNRTP